MVEIVIERFQARYSLPEDPERAAERRMRIEGPLAAVTGEHLEAALARLGLGADIILVRDLVAPIRLKRGETAWQAALAWSDAIAAALESRLRDGDGPGVVRFRRRSDAVEALVCAALQADDRQDWAWRQLGFLQGGSGVSVSAGERIAAAAGAIAAEPARSAVILLRLAETGWLAALARELGPWAAADLAAAVAEALGGLAFAEDAAPLDPNQDPVMAQQAIGRAFVAAIRAAPQEARRAWAQLAATILEAPRLAAGRADLEILIRRWLHAAERASEPRTARAGGRGRRPSTDGPFAKGQKTTETASPATPKQDQQAPGDEHLADETEETIATADQEPAWTAFGGLMLLLPAVAESGAGEVLFDVEDGDALRARLHALALALGGPELRPGDPAAMGFTGLAPLARPPAELVEPDLIAQARDRLVGHLRERLPDWAEESEAAFLARIIARPARITFEPGWIEVRFDLDAIDADLRRAGLDLDPDFLPWLGLVLKYRYV